MNEVLLAATDRSACLAATAATVLFAVAPFLEVDQGIVALSTALGVIRGFEVSQGAAAPEIEVFQDAAALADVGVEEVERGVINHKSHKKGGQETLFFMTSSNRAALSNDCPK